MAVQDGAVFLNLRRMICDESVGGALDAYHDASTQ